MKSFVALAVVLAATFTQSVAHYTFPALIINGQRSADWQYVRKTNNYNHNGPIEDVNVPDFRCYNSQVQQGAQTATVAAGSTVGIGANNGMFHQSVVNIYMAKAPGNVANWDGSGSVWFKVHEILPTISNGQLSFPAMNQDRITFTIPSNLPAGQYLVRTENIALHMANRKGGAQFYISCAQINVTGGGNGNPGPLVSIPGVYNGEEPGILINIYANHQSYTQPGPSVWRG